MSIFNALKKQKKVVLEDTPFWMANVLGRHEITESRYTMIFAVVTVAFVLMSVILGNTIVNQSKTISELKDSQKIHLYPDHNGGYVSSKSMPETRIVSFVDRFQNLFFNWMPETASVNIQAAKKMMSPELLVKQEDVIDRILTRAGSQQITQFVARDENDGEVVSIEKLSHGYKVVYDAFVRRSVRGEEYARGKGTITLILQHIEPNEHYRWGLRLVFIDQKWRVKSAESQ